MNWLLLYSDLKLSGRFLQSSPHNIPNVIAKTLNPAKQIGHNPRIQRLHSSAIRLVSAITNNPAYRPNPLASPFDLSKISKPNNAMLRIIGSGPAIMCIGMVIHRSLLLGMEPAPRCQPGWAGARPG